MGNIMYSRYPYIVFPVRGGFVVYNILKDFQVGHTHIKKFDTCISIISCAYRKKVPDRLSSYLLVSLVRLSTDPEYIKQVEEKLEVRKRKGQKPVCRKRKQFNK